MGTTDTRLAASALDALGRSGIRFALLHGELQLIEGKLVTDIDVVVDRPASDAARAAIQQLADVGLRPIAVSPYDVGALTLFLATRDASEGVQLDLIHDPEGRGKRFVRTGPLLRSAITGRRWPVLQPIDELLYLCLKRYEKGQVDELLQIVKRIRTLPRHEVAARASSILAPPISDSAMRLIDHGTVELPYPHSVGHLLRTVHRYSARVLRPVGYWVHLYGDDDTSQIAGALAERFGRILVAGGSFRSPERTMYLPIWWFREVAPMRWRPSLVVTWSLELPKHRKPGLAPRAIPADLTLVLSDKHHAGPHSLAEKIVESMTARVRVRHGWPESTRA